MNTKRDLIDILVKDFQEVHPESNHATTQDLRMKLHGLDLPDLEMMVHQITKQAELEGDIFDLVKE